MGHFSKTCVLTNLQISGGDKVYAIPVHYTPKMQEDYNWVPLGGMIEAIYDDYGAVENVVETDFTRFINKVYGFDIVSLSFEGIDPYNKYNVLTINSLTPGFIDLLSSLPDPFMNNGEEIKSLQPLADFGFTIDNDSSCRYGDVDIDFTREEAHSGHYFWYSIFKYNGLEMKLPFYDFPSVMNGIKVVMNRGVNQHMPLPGLSMQHSAIANFSSNTSVIYVLKDAFEEFEEALNSDKDKYNFHTYGKTTSEKVRAFDLSTLDKLLSEAKKVDFNEISVEKVDECLDIIAKSFTNKLQYMLQYSASISELDPLGFVKFMQQNEDFNDLDRLSVLSHALYAQGRNFTPPSRTFQDREIDISKLILDISVKQCDSFIAKRK